jgi:putative transcriptional regulator
MRISSPKHIYNRIKVFRVEANLTRSQLAEKLNVNVQTIGYLEREEYNASLELALKIADVFHLKVEDIFSFDKFDSITKL